MHREISDQLVDKVQSLLGKEGLDFFHNLKVEHGVVDPVLFDKIPGGPSLPHPVYLREGMQVRNLMRSTGLCDDWNSEDLDFYWTEVVEKAIEKSEIQIAWRQSQSEKS